MGCCVFRQARVQLRGQEADALQEGFEKIGQKGPKVGGDSHCCELTAAPEVAYNQSGAGVVIPTTERIPLRGHRQHEHW